MGDPVAQALTLFRGGLFCSEAIVQAFDRHLRLGLPEEVHKVATVFGAGFGGAKCSCGSLTGALIIAGALKGRTNAATPIDDVFPLAAALHDRFRERFGVVCCRVLTKGQQWGTPAHHQYCERYVVGAAEILRDLLAEPITR